MQNYTVEFCPVCGALQDYQCMSSIDDMACEAMTKCNECGHEDYFAYGMYEEVEKLKNKSMLGGEL